MQTLINKYYNELPFDPKQSDQLFLKLVEFYLKDVEKNLISVEDAVESATADWEMAEETQIKIKELWPLINTNTLLEMTNFEEYQQEFLRLFGFGIDGVDYDLDVDPVNPY